MNPVRNGFGLAILLIAVLGLSAAWGQAPQAQVIVLSDSSPNISVIDGQTHRVIRTANVPGLRAWGWNDANNYFDGRNLWLGSFDPDSGERFVNILDVESLQVVHRISLGTDRWGIFIGQLSKRTGTVFVAKGVARQLYSIDPKTYQIVRVLDLPIPPSPPPPTGQQPGPQAVACDSDLAIAFDGRERIFVPAWGGDLIVSVDTETMTVSSVMRSEPGRRPWMATPTPDGRRLWVNEQGGGGNVIVNTLALQVVERVPTAAGPIMGTFSPDGTVHFTGHVASPIVTAHNTQSFQQVWRAQVGANPAQIGVHPAGSFVFAAITREGAVAVLDAATGRVVTRIPLGTNPWGLFVLRTN